MIFKTTMLGVLVFKKPQKLVNSHICLVVETLVLFDQSMLCRPYIREP